MLVQSEILNRKIVPGLIVTECVATRCVPESIGKLIDAPSVTCGMSIKLHRAQGLHTSCHMAQVPEVCWLQYAFIRVAPATNQCLRHSIEIQVAIGLCLYTHQFEQVLSIHLLVTPKTQSKIQNAHHIHGCMQNTMVNTCIQTYIGHHKPYAYTQFFQEDSRFPYCDFYKFWVLNVQKLQRSQLIT